MYFSRRRRLPSWLEDELSEGLEISQKRALPEDIALYGAPGFEEFHRSLDVKWFRGLNHSELYQVCFFLISHFLSVFASRDIPCY